MGQNGPQNRIQDRKTLRRWYIDFTFHYFWLRFFDFSFCRLFSFDLDQRKKPTKWKIKKSQQKKMKNKTDIPSAKCFSFLNLILRFILPHHQPFLVNFQLFDRPFLPFSIVFENFHPPLSQNQVCMAKTFFISGLSKSKYSRKIYFERWSKTPPIL